MNGERGKSLDPRRGPEALRRRINGDFRTRFEDPKLRAYLVGVGHDNEGNRAKAYDLGERKQDFAARRASLVREAAERRPSLLQPPKPRVAQPSRSPPTPRIAPADSQPAHTPNAKAAALTLWVVAGTHGAPGCPCAPARARRRSRRGKEEETECESR